MSVQQVPMYRVICDRCGISAHEHGDYYAWTEVEGAEIEADASDWTIEGGNHLCPDCTPTWRDDEEESPLDRAVPA